MRGTMPDGAATKVLWVVNNPRGRGPARVRDTNLTGAGVIHLSGSGSVGSAVGLVSIVKVPTPGCWRFVVRSGNVKGVVIMRAVK